MTTKPRKFDTAAARSETSEETIRLEPWFDLSLAKRAGWPVEVWLKYQLGILKAVEPMATGWLERRRDAAADTLVTLERLASCSDLHEVASVQRSWLEGTIKRLDTDFHALADHAVAVSHEAMAATREAAQTSSEVVALAIRPAAQQAEPSVEEAA